MGSRQLDDKILQILLRHKKIQWNKIRNALRLEIQPKNIGVFNVQVSRALKRLINQKLIVKDEQGHKAVFYTLTEAGRKEALKTISDLTDLVVPLLEGAFSLETNDLPSFEEFKQKILEGLEPLLLEVYKEFKDEWEEMKKQRKM